MSLDDPRPTGASSLALPRERLEGGRASLAHSRMPTMFGTKN